MSKILPEPAFEIPLSDAELVVLGRISAVFAQIDELLTWLICIVHQIDHEQHQIYFRDRMLSARLTILKDGVNRIARPEAADAVRAFIDKMGEIVTDRNLVVHGCWGAYTADYETYKIGPFSRSKPLQRFYVDDLPRLYGKSCEASRLLVTALSKFQALVEPDPDEKARLIWTTSNEPPNQGFHSKGSVAFRVPDPTPG